MELQELYVKYKPLLFSVAYRMIGSVADAEDIVHDVYVKVDEKNLRHLDNEKAYLCKMVTNRCIDYLNSAAYKREVYVGPWLPEPLILSNDDPAIELINGETVSFAILLLLEKLKPMERAIFILRSVLEYDYSTISSMLNISEANCRKIFSRVTKKFPLINSEDFVELEPRNDEIIQTFVLAMHEGNIKKIEELLCHDVALYSDGGGKVFAALKPIYTKNLVLRFIQSLLSQNQSGDDPTVVNIANVNGQTGLIVKGDDNVKTVISFEVKGNRIANIYIVRNPDKLQHVSLASS